MAFVHNTCNIMLIKPPYICDSKLNICDTLSNILKGTMNMKQYIKKRTGAVKTRVTQGRKCNYSESIP